MSRDAAAIPEVIVRPCSSQADCDAVAALCGSSFPEEVHSQGLSVQQWSQIEADDLKATPEWWRQIGLACQGDKLLGVVVLTVENEADDSMSWGEYSRRVGCGPTILSMMYDRVLDEALLEHECLVDFIAVSPDARGKGVGGKLMRWAEQAGAAILAETEAAAVAAQGVEMSLWVAADNVVAVRLYERCGYTHVKRTDTGVCRCMASNVLNWFLGHPVWIKMHKMLPAPEGQEAVQPPQQAMPAAVAAGCRQAAASAAAAGGDAAQFENVPLEAPAGRQQQHCGAATTPRSPGTSLLHKLGLGFFGAAKPAGEAAQNSSGVGATVSTGSPQDSRGSATPRILAVGSGLTAAALPRALSSVQGVRSKGSGSEGVQCIPLHAPGMLVVERELSGAARDAAAPASTVGTASVASASVASFPLGSDSEEEDDGGSVRRPEAVRAHRLASAAGPSGTGGPCAGAFELVSLSTTSVTAAR